MGTGSVGEGMVVQPWKYPEGTNGEEWWFSGRRRGARNNSVLPQALGTGGEMDTPSSERMFAWCSRARPVQVTFASVRAIRCCFYARGVAFHEKRVPA